MTPHWRWTLNSDKYSVCTKDLPLRLKFWSISRYEFWLSRYKVPENQNYTAWPQTKLKHLTIKSSFYTLYTYPRCPNFGQFCSTTRCFQGTRSSKIRNALNGPKLNFLTVKSILWTLSIYLCGPNFGPFHPMTSSFQDTRSPKIGNAPNDPKLNLTGALELLGHLSDRKKFSLNVYRGWSY